MQKKEYGKDDWYRRTTWDSDDQEAFFARLKRSRGQFHIAQYLRIQAIYLQDEYPENALQLLRMIREEFPEPSELASTYLQTAQCLVAVGKKGESIEWFRKVLDQEETHKGVQTQGYLDYPIFIVTEEKKDLYSEAKQILLKYVGRLMFPVDRYRWNMAMALIEWEEQNNTKAADHAKEALLASKIGNSGFRYHPKVGLVKKQDRRIKTLLEKIQKHNKPAQGNPC